MPSTVHTHTYVHTLAHKHTDTHTQCECNPLNRSGNFTAAVGAGDRDDSWTEAVSPQRKANTYAHVHTHIHTHTVQHC